MEKLNKAAQDLQIAALIINCEIMCFTRAFVIGILCHD